MSNFYCYSKPLKNFLKEKNIFSVDEGLNKNSNKIFWIFDRCEELDVALTEWKSNKLKAIEYIKNINK